MEPNIILIYVWIGKSYGFMNAGSFRKDGSDKDNKKALRSALS